MAKKGSKLTTPDEDRQRRSLFLVTLEKAGGNVSYACSLFKIHKDTYYEWKKKDKWFRDSAEKICKDKNEEMNDFAENKLFTHMKKGNVATLIFYLKTRHPGYKQKLEVKNTGAIKVSDGKVKSSDQKLINQAILYGLGKVPVPNKQRSTIQKKPRKK